MLLIALSGGTSAERVAIADRLIESGKGQLVAFAQATPIADFGPRRARILREALEGMEDAPAALGGVVVVHCLTEEEAELVRARGGVVWHVYGTPSRLVVIRHADPIVTDGQAGFRHVREPLEALSELLLSRLSSGSAPLAMAALASLANG